MKDIIAFWGYPHPDIIKKTKEEYKNAKWLDLDIDYNAPKLGFLPENYCKNTYSLPNPQIFNPFL